jgi:iron complex transport system ATP-binding protein
MWECEMQNSAVALELEGVSVHAGPRVVLENVHLRVLPGRLVAVLGPNGAGKSTLLGVFGGWVRYQQGQCRWEGKRLDEWSAAQLACRRAVMLQHTHVAFDFTAEEVVRLGRYPHRHRPHPREDSVALEAMAQADVMHLRDAPIGVLSGGERARVHWARAWAQLECPGWHARRALPAGWLLLDEPTAALDLAHQHALLAQLRHTCEAYGVGALVVLHDLNLALRYAHEAVLVHQGRVRAHGGVETVLSPSEVAAVWGVQPRWLHDPVTARKHLII